MGPFGTWPLLSGRVTFPGPSTLKHISAPHPSSWPSNIPPSGQTTFCLFIIRCQTFELFRYSGHYDNAAVVITYMFLRGYLYSILLAVYLEGTLLGLGNSLTFWGTAGVFFKVLYRFLFHQQRKRLSVAPHPSQYLSNHPVGVKCVIVALIRISLITNHAV